MSIFYKYGKGSQSSRNIPFGILELKITPEMCTMRLDEIANLLAKKYDIIDGNIELSSIDFSYKKEGELK